MKAKRAIVRSFGGPEVIEWEEVELGAPAGGEVLVEHEAIGLNFIDTYFRTGLYPAELPTLLGQEAAGRVVDAGPGSGLKAGDRVATFGPVRGAYATARLIGADRLFRIPDDISAETAAASLLKGCTTEYLVERCARVRPGSTVLVHAAAGGVGQLLVQWLKAIGARVIGTVSSDAKAALARRAGADEVLVTGDGIDIAERVRELTGATGVEVIFDGVGRNSWDSSLASVARRGLIVSFGNASGPVTGVNLGSLSSHGSLFVTRPTLADYYATAEERRAGVDRLWSMIREGTLEVTVGARYPLDRAADAQADLEARRTTGSVVLVP